MEDPNLQQEELLSSLSSSLNEWRQKIEVANQNNIFCHCRKCDHEWVASTPVPCHCGSLEVEYIACWQFPDD